MSVLLGQNGRLVIQRKLTESFSFDRSNIDSDRNRLIDTNSTSLSNGDYVLLQNQYGLPFDFDGDGQADCPDGHNIYAGPGNVLSQAVYQRTSDAGRFYDTNNNRAQYANNGLTPNHQLTQQAPLFVSANELGNLKFYKNWSDSINRKQPISVYNQSYGTTTITPIQQTERLIGEIDSWEFSSSKAELDLTTLGDDFVKRIGGLISGSGSLDCYFTLPSKCNQQELNYYLFNIINKVSNQSDLTLYLYLNYNDTIEDEDDVSILYYKVDVIITNSSIQLNNQGAITGSINFVSVGQYDLCVGSPNYLDEFIT